MITAEELTKRRGGRAVVSDVTFRLSLIHI